MDHQQNNTTDNFIICKILCFETCIDNADMDNLSLTQPELQHTVPAETVWNS